VEVGPSSHLSAVGQNRPAAVEINGLKTSHFLEDKTGPQNHRNLAASHPRYG
jgi:hypothetical protein